MGIFDKNIHMNGSRTTYQAFLDLADAAEEKGGTIGDRTVRLVKAGDYTAFVATATDLLFAIHTRRSRTAPGDSTPARARNCSTMPWRRRSTSRVNSRIETGTDLPSCRSWPWGWKRGTGRRLPHASCS